MNKYRYRSHFNTQFLNRSAFFWGFKGCFNTNGCNVDDVRKVGYSRPS